ncbi:universal stress protein [Tardiphaga sp.]|uniref:universal stress protein n=1 Tax=Tardiphaga sp. TaxID=1926292 RepID=UPI00352A0D87
MSAEICCFLPRACHLIVPEEWKFDRIGEHVTIGWNASQQARRAVIDALPLLKDAISVSVVIVDPETNDSHGQQPGSDIARYLARHGAAVTVAQTASNGETIANALLRQARDCESDLIVIGAYSHSRTGELIFGGVTRSLTRHVAIPTLIAH